MAELLVEFFRYYSWRFDLLRHVVSMRTRRVVTKLDKTETHAWFHSDHLRYCTYNLNTPLFNVADRTVRTFFSIEDPFETHYDVAHVVKGPQMAYLRKEFLVSPSNNLCIALHFYNEVSASL